MLQTLKVAERQPDEATQGPGLPIGQLRTSALKTHRVIQDDAEEQTNLPRCIGGTKLVVGSCSTPMREGSSSLYGKVSSK